MKPNAPTGNEGRGEGHQPTAPILLERGVIFPADRRKFELGWTRCLPTPDDYAPMLAERARAERKLLGARQQHWLEDILAASVRAGKPWQVLGNRVVMARAAGPDLVRAYGERGYA